MGFGGLGLGAWALAFGGFGRLLCGAASRRMFTPSLFEVQPVQALGSSSWRLASGDAGCLSCICLGVPLESYDCVSQLETHIDMYVCRMNLNTI